MTISEEQWEKSKAGKNEVKFVRLDDGTFLRSDGDHGFTEKELFGPELLDAVWSILPWNDRIIDTVTVTLKPRERGS